MTTETSLRSPCLVFVAKKKNIVQKIKEALK